MFGTFGLFCHRLGVSSSQLTNSMIFQRGCFTTNQMIYAGIFVFKSFTNDLWNHLYTAIKACSCTNHHQPYIITYIHHVYIYKYHINIIYMKTIHYIISSFWTMFDHFCLWHSNNFPFNLPFNDEFAVYFHHHFGDKQQPQPARLEACYIAFSATKIKRSDVLLQYHKAEVRTSVGGYFWKVRWFRWLRCDSMHVVRYFLCFRSHGGYPQSSLGVSWIFDV